MDKYSKYVPLFIEFYLSASIVFNIVTSEFNLLRNNVPVKLSETLGKIWD